MSDRRLRATVLLAEAASLGVGLPDLIAAHADVHPELLTLGAHVEALAPTFSTGTAATYRSYWRLAVGHLGDRRLVEISVVDLQAVVGEAVRRARQHHPDSSGRSTQETCVAALRALFSRAFAAGLISTNPAAALTKPRRVRSRRRALDDIELAEVIDAIRTTSNDPDLDLLLVRFHLETGARRQGALNLRLCDLDPHRATVWLREKNGSDREQPVSPTLVTLLERHARQRGAHRGDGPIFRRLDGTPITTRRYDRIFDRARRCLSWTDRTPVSAHVLRHTAINTVGRLAGYPVAQAFAGHAPPSVTGLYMQATLAEIADAIAALTGEPHPLARQLSQHGNGRCRRPAPSSTERARTG